MMQSSDVKKVGMRVGIMIKVEKFPESLYFIAKKY